MNVLRAVSLLVLGSAAFGSTTTGAAAQERDLPRLTLEGRAGYTNPTRALGRTGVLNTSEGIGYASFEKADGTPVFGAGATARVAGPFSLRILADYALETETRGQWFCDGLLPCPAVLQPVEGRVRTWSLGADLQVRLPEVAWRIEPTAFVGVSRRSHRIRWEPFSSDVPIPTAFDQARIYVRPGVGLARSVGGFSLFVEADALIGEFGADRPLFVEGTRPVDQLPAPITQVDLGFTVGARVPLW